MLKFGKRQFDSSERIIMAVVNCSPDSKYDRGKHLTPSDAIETIMRMEDEGAHIVDLGGMAASPGKDVSINVEVDRLGEVIVRTRQRCPDLVISVDTYRSQVAEALAGTGIDVINDNRQGFDPKLVAVVAKNDLGLICTHAGYVEPNMRSRRAQFTDIIEHVASVTSELADFAVSLGVDENSIAIDPGIDCGKATHHSVEILRRLPELSKRRWPVMVCVSNKPFLGEAAGVFPLPERLDSELSVAAAVIAALGGAQIFRVHNVRETRLALNLVGAVQGTRPVAYAHRGLM